LTKMVMSPSCSQKGTGAARVVDLAAPDGSAVADLSESGFSTFVLWINRKAECQMSVKTATTARLVGICTLSDTRFPTLTRRDQLAVPEGRKREERRVKTGSWRLRRTPCFSTLRVAPTPSAGMTEVRRGHLGPSPR